MTTGVNEITVVTGRRSCRDCDYVNEAGNEYCVHCGAPMGNVPEILGDPGLAAQNRLTWQVYGVDTKLVGRDSELRLLTGRFEQVIETDKLHPILLLGAVGLGKSRLIDEFSRVINTTFGSSLLVSGAWRDTAEPPFAIIDRVLRNRFYIPERLPEDEARDRLLDGVRAIIRNPAATEVAHRIGSLIDLNFPDSPFAASEQADETNEASWRALARLIRTDAGNNPMVVVLEDMHHASAESLEALPVLANLLAEAPILCVTSADPSVMVERADLIAKIPGLEVIELRSLADDDIRNIIDQVLSRASDVPDTLYRRVCDNAMGNPWIAEEILRLLMSTGAVQTNETEWRIDLNLVSQVQLPRGVDDVVQAGIEWLTAEERSLLEEAAVVGETFWLGPLTLLAHQLGEVSDLEFPWNRSTAIEDGLLGRLDQLAEKDLVRRRPEARYPNEVEFAFKHAAVRRHLLDMLDEERAARLHGLVAQWHELNLARGVRELHEVTAHHHDRAGHTLRAAVAYSAAGQHAQERHANRRALEHYQRALELLDDSHLPKKVELLHEIGSIYDLIGEYEKAIPFLQRLLRYAWQLASLGKGGAAHNKLGRVFRSLGQYTLAVDHFEHALYLFRRANDRAGIASTLDDIGKVHWIKADYDAALALYREALALRRELGEPRSLGLSLNHLGTLMVHRGDFREALRHLREALALRREIGDQRGVTDSLNNLGVILAERGDLEAALRLWSEAVEVAQAIGDRMLEGILRNNMGEVAGQLGRLDDAEGHLQAAEQICEECAEQRLLFDVMRNRGLLELKRSDPVHALELIEKSLALAKRLKTRALEALALKSLAEVYAHELLGASDDETQLERAEGAYRQALEILKEVGQEAEVGRTHYAYGRFLVEQGLSERAREELGRAIEILERLGVKSSLEKARQLLDAL